MHDKKITVRFEWEEDTTVLRAENAFTTVESAEEWLKSFNESLDHRLTKVAEDVDLSDLPLEKKILVRFEWFEGDLTTPIVSQKVFTTLEQAEEWAEAFNESLDHRLTKVAEDVDLSDLPL